MKIPLSLCLLFILGAVSYGDIQDPPMNDQGPTRKLGRGISNILFHDTEFIYTVSMMNEREGNSAALSYGVVKGVGRCVYRLHKGFFDVLTFPFPVYKGSYRQPYKRDVPWIHGGYDEFPPELGFETKYRYSREQAPY
ncbi:MAG: exosortase system-associated protein, TIGR04073 family [Verrucomicrobiota bacterium]|nr:exosortase system-associated protein, TIGR04073 family [Verrucomicrobiota bacterium]